MKESAQAALSFVRANAEALSIDPIETIILPEKNEMDLLEIPEEAKQELEFRFVRDVTEALEIALTPSDGGERGDS